MMKLAFLATLLVAGIAMTMAFSNTMSTEADNILRQGSNIDTNNVDALVNLVRKNNAQECLSKVICELSQNSQSHGDAGATFGRSLLKFRDSKHPDVKQYVNALTTGAKAKTMKECASAYPRCHHSTTEIITVGNKLLRPK